MRRDELLNALICDRGLTSYLEIGCHQNATFRAVECAEKVGVDPLRGGTLRLTSDAFFSQNERTFDLIFIDGRHTFAQSLCDVCNSLGVLNPRGAIVLHDCLPKTEMQQMPTPQPRIWTGEVWKTLAVVRTWPHVDAAVLDDDWGLGVILPRPNTDRLRILPELSWETYRDQGKALLQVVDDAGMAAFLGEGESAK
ncbi:class I SAM-dependent methyltransferase [Planctellipticum variicoloris]|uniref:class I SAM-dependent methyltransferase n=1 Tax=Planctellipticum variicoloris TaxID=3064265 RepID=UPI003013AEDF|nr:class I SAM-dependent methyltransferase [Planctomycetaceae bacterium SH412]